MSDQSGMPEGVINANPPGGYESGDIADGETRERNRDAAGSPALADAGVSAAGGDEPSDPIEAPDASQGADPDLATDEES